MNRPAVCARCGCGEEIHFASFRKDAINPNGKAMRRCGACFNDCRGFAPKPRPKPPRRGRWVTHHRIEDTSGTGVFDGRGKYPLKHLRLVTLEQHWVPAKQPPTPRPHRPRRRGRWVRIGVFRRWVDPDDMRRYRRIVERWVPAKGKGS